MRVQIRQFPLIKILFLSLGFSLIALESKHTEMNYGPVISTTIDADYPENNLTLKGLVFRLENKVFPKNGTPVGKGTFIKASRRLTNPDLAELYRFQRERSKGYLINIPKGRFKVNLHFAEIKRKSTGERVFDIKIQDEIKVNDLDVLERVGFEKPLVLSFNDVDCSDGFLKLDFIQKSQRSSPAIAAIVIENETYKRQINCGGKALGDYEADWDKKDYLEDPYSSGMIFDSELLRFSAAWTYGFVKLRGTAYDGSHGSYPEISGSQIFGNSAIPAWIPAGEKLAFDPRKQQAGPLPAEWGRYKGMYLSGKQNLLYYRLSHSDIYDLPGTELVSENLQAFVRDIQVSPLNTAYKQLLMESEEKAQIKGNMAIYADEEQPLIVGVVGASGISYANEKLANGRYGLFLNIPANKKLNYKLAFCTSQDEALFQSYLDSSSVKQTEDFEKLKRGGQKRWAEEVKTQGIVRKDDKASLIVDELSLPINNPWQSWMRPAAFDFFADGDSMAMSTWSGDVWLAKNLNDSLDNIIWTRFATGLFHPLGLKIVDGKVYVQGRDQITILHDNDKNGEADFYECFNNDVQISSNFHEFSFELHRDQEGNFYYVKGAPVKAGGEGFGELGPHHGALIKVSKDGSQSKVIASGFRAPNGMGIKEDGQITVSDNEGNWVPATPINWIEEGGFYGVVPTSQTADFPKKRDKLICYIPHSIDNSAGGQVWVPEGAWGDLGGELIHLSYGKAKIFHVLKEKLGENIQGGVVDLDPSGGFDAGIMRARFNKQHQSLYLCGLKGWQTSGVKDGGLYRVRYQQQTECRPLSLRAGKNGLKLEFSQPLAEESALDTGNYSVEQWVYHVSEKYGSKHYRVPKRSPWNFESTWEPLSDDTLKSFNQKEFKDEQARKTALDSLLEKVEGQDQVYIKSISLSDDRKTVFLEIPDIQAVMQMKISFNLLSQQGEKVKKEIYSSIHQLGDWKGQAGLTLQRTELKQEKTGVKVSFRHRGQAETDQRVQRLVALYVNEMEDITPFLDHGPFDARFEAYLKSEQNMKVQFCVKGRGQFKLSVNGETLSDLGGIDEQALYEVELKKGFNKLLLDYHSPGRGAAQLRLLWQSEDFPLEAIPPTSLFYEAHNQSELKSAQLLRQGRQLFAEYNCMSCHDLGAIKTAMKELELQAPSLKDIGKRVNHTWLSHWIRNPHQLKNKSKMPHVLKDLSEDEAKQVAADIALYLNTVDAKESALDSNQLELGTKLFADLACASCHSFDKSPGDEKISLFYSNSKYAPQALSSFLQEPGKFNASGKMPDFNLSEYEAQSLETYLRKVTRDNKLEVQRQGNAHRGELAYQKYNCQTCHESSSQGNAMDLFAQESMRTLREAHSEFTLNEQEIDALQSFLESDGKSLSRHNSTEFAQRQVDTLKCTHCHSRDDQASHWISPHNDPKDLPPPISFIGEKLHKQALHDLLSGKAEKARPWMKARMPAFKSRAEDLAEGLAHEHGYSQKNVLEMPQNNLELGKKLLGSQGGFSCIVCHDVGSQKALAPFGAPGVNLKYSAQRLRYDYYLRWMLNPQRVQKSSPMTRFSSDNQTTFLKEIHSGDAKKQFNEIWNYLESLNK